MFELSELNSIILLLKGFSQKSNDPKFKDECAHKNLQNHLKISISALPELLGHTLRNNHY